MLYFQRPQNFLTIFIAIYLAQFSLTVTAVECIIGFGQQKGGPALCNDKDFVQWKCQTPSCSRDGHLWIPMTSCLYNGVAGSGVSNQQCASYNLQFQGNYECINPGRNRYLCPYTPSNVPFITCTSCYK
ncbi:uncharacterized protein MELLADRAFT_123578 [Melampsora larici-populina 98AG31]|uniref:Secreted protein n=1 Tax=Melampsora larici-populina (strain 98AG31 / pathotype 3-4-7) TaxID=747676 RepID=F4SA79_MELLP|nr:uncharacterized protein MELLADRAFT_123578 [Melampsora larici-populina 98AG31]EGF98406.1 secreted protein [Melampsora larici-populina 98AG31]